MVHEHVHFPHQSFPWKAFAMAAGMLDQSLGQGRRDTKDCMLDPWTLHFKARYDSKLDSDGARMDCPATVVQVRLETAQIETRRANTRRRVYEASEQTHAQRLEVASNSFVTARVVYADESAGHERDSPEADPTSARGMPRVGPDPACQETCPWSMANIYT